MRGPGVPGFTLVELLLALGIVAAVLVILFGGLRVGLGAWQRGEERTTTLDHARSVLALLERALDGASPYRFTPEGRQQAQILFEGAPDRLTFATFSPPFPTPTHAAFTAVSLSGDGGALAVRQQVLPNWIVPDRFEPALVDAQTRAVRFRYLGQEPEAWQDEWDMSKEDGLPRAVEITLAGRDGARSLVVPIRATTP
ncbi:MAG TPA: type II secretion system protein GspJ [Methylomirabilota bacterium]|nr:type II secretion system protein GspJ [Methylomirabilota bacterium]